MLQTLWIKGIGLDTRRRASKLMATHVQRATSIGRNHNLPLVPNLIKRWVGTSQLLWRDRENICCLSLHRIDTPSGPRLANLIISKGKVTPINTVSVYKLELIGGVLLATLINYDSLQLYRKPTRIYCWSDSKIVLAWLQGQQSRWQSLFAHRIAKIIDLLPEIRWRHLPNNANSADLAT